MGGAISAIKTESGEATISLRVDQNGHAHNVFNNLLFNALVKLTKSHVLRDGPMFRI